MKKTKIPWCDCVWNPVTGCTKCSPACDHCYAERMAKRLQGMGLEKYRDGFAVRRHCEALDEPLNWKGPLRVFVCSMSDPFHERVDEGFVWEMFLTMAAKPDITFLLLTKRYGGMVGFIINRFRNRIVPPNIWFGMSAWDQSSFRSATMSLDRMVGIPGVRFISLEPLLGPVRIESKIVDWIIIGAESGPGRREMKEEWVRDIVADCQRLKIPLFYKQAYIDGKKVSCPEIDGKRYMEFPR